MKKIKDKKIFILIAMLLVFTIGYFIIVNKVSYAFDNNYDLSNIYENKIELITKSAIEYGKNNLENFNEDGILYINVQTLIDVGLLIPNEEGNIINYENESEILNSKKIRLKNENGKINIELYN